MDKEEARPRAGVKSATAFRTISEVSDELEVPQHVLRFWETKFPQVRPLKRGGGRRYYRPEDVALLRNIRRLLYSEGYTIKGVQRLLKESRSAGTGSDAEVLVETLADADMEGPESSCAEMPGEEEAASGDETPNPAKVDSGLSPAVSPAPPAVPVIPVVAVPSASPPSAPVDVPSAASVAAQPLVVALPLWHRRQLAALRAELIELKALLQKAGR